MPTQLPNFSQFDPKRFTSEFTELLANHRQKIQQLSAQTNFSWQNFIQPLDDLANQLGKLWSPLSHLNAVMNSDEIRNTYNDCLPKLSDYYTELGQNNSLYLAYQAIQNSDEFKQLDTAQQKVIANALRDFQLSGVALKGKQRQRYQVVQQELATLATKFSENSLDSTQAWQHSVNDETLLAGLPAHAIATAKQKAQEKKLDGWLFTLDAPCYIAVMTYADSNTLRETMYRAYQTRSSELSDDGKFDNSKIMQAILALRHELAALLGFNHFTDYSLATKMAKEPAEIFNFIEQLISKIKPAAEKEFVALQHFAKHNFSVAQLHAWDLAYYSQKAKEHYHAINDEALRPYFPQNHVLQGMFAVIKKLYGITINKIDNADVWHQDVTCYAVTDSQGIICAYLYMDLYARDKKRSGAWMDDYCSRYQLANGELQLPIAYLNCNFSAPINGQPALLTHDDVVTLFHECGHCLHHVLTKINYLDVSGINGVAWDAVELPSQFFENWCWQPESLSLISQHYQTKQPLPTEQINNLLAAKNFQVAMHMARQLEFALFDFRIHHEFNPAEPDRIQTILDDVRQTIAVITPPNFNRFQHSFSHIFAGGYAAGYYSYLWAEVLSADAFSVFMKHGIFDQATGRKFLHTILEQGGSKDALELFIDFRGQAPSVDALLEQNGIETN